MLLPAGYLVANTARAAYANYKVNAEEIPSPPVAKVSVVLPAWKEPDEFLEASMQSIKNQSVVQMYPSQVELVFVGCESINMDIPNKYADKVLCAPRGKLQARHMGIENSVGDIIVATDADCYMGRNWLNMMLQPFNDPSVVAVAGTTWLDVLEPVASIAKIVHFNRLISGRNSALRKSAYYATGGFSFDVDPSDAKAMQEIEEFDFRRKLNALGNVVLVDAPVRHVAWEVAGRGIRSKYDFNTV